MAVIEHILTLRSKGQLKGVRDVVINVLPAWLCMFM